MTLPVDAKTKIICLFGKPAKHSLSPIIHNAAFKELNLNYIYVVFEIENIKEAIQSVKTLGIHGFNVTAPYKIPALEAVEIIDPVAKFAGSMNTGYWKESKLHGTNTDVIAIQKGIADWGYSQGNPRILLLGAGGAARAAITASPKSEFVLVNRTLSKAVLLQKEFSEHSITVEPFSKLKILMKKADILVNATPIGREEQQSPFPLDEIKTSHHIIDLVYRNSPTRVISFARKNNIPAIDGKQFLVKQGITSFKYWTGITPPESVLLDSLSK